VIRYSLEEAMASLRRSGRAAAMSTGTIAIAFLALGGFLLVSGNLQRAVQRWMEAAEVSVFLRDEIDANQVAAVEAAIEARPGVAAVEFVDKEEALARFRSGFPELADVATSLERNPFPASFDVRLRPGPDAAAEAEAVSAEVARLDGVADVQFDRRWLERALALLAGARFAALTVAVVLLLGAAFTVAAVVRLSLQARRDELDIMQLVGAPMSVIRGPFVVEGLILGGAGALLALGALALGFSTLRTSIGGDATGVLGDTPITFLSPGDMALLVMGGLVVGALAGFVASRAAR
jgi:cell division transport system permease protein